jgi:mono/diheme cytochrome c family protein
MSSDVKEGVFSTSVLATIALLSGSDVCLAAPAGGSFTQAEVVAGHASYHGYCSGCHGEDLQGFTDAPPLTGATFKFDWSKYTVRRFYVFVSKTMPQGLEGDLRPKTYSNVIAFLLAANGARAGSGHLNPNSSTKIGDIASGGPVYAVIRAPIDPQREAGP